MEPRQVKTAADARRIVKERGLSHVKVGVHDIDGILRGKYIHIDKFHSALEGGMGFCDVVLGWDANDQLYDNVTYTGWHTAHPDAIEGLHTETGAGVLEAALRVQDGLRAADSAALFKLYTKVLAQKRDWLATFMAKWSKDWPGCGGHMHMSLWKGGTSAFHDEKGTNRMGTAMSHFVGGQQALMPELLAMVASNV